ncbi:MAG: hypothetical protein A2V66_07125 [Ignavibacteria bacterium RBG_13_36_8]|nr:MAG: hypothetical protein A2V66_07125 [Ignavibacteria bacterium RBG_13_36_8]
MAYSKFYINITIRVLLILLTCFILAFIYYQRIYIYTLIGLSIITIIQVYLLIRFFIGSHKYLTAFLLQIKESKNISSLPVINSKSPYSEFNYYFEEISKIIRKSKIEKENQYLYLQYVVEHVGVGLLAFDSKGKVELINKAALQLFKIPSLHNIKTLDAIQKGLYDILIQLKFRQTKLVVVNVENELLHLSISATVFKMMDREIKLVSLQDIKAELDEKELESWQKLIRILNHEIMNSITPVTTLTSTISKKLKNNGEIKKAEEMNNEILNETVSGLDLIEERGKGLIDFVNKYRSLTSTIKPEFKRTPIQKLFRHIEMLFKNELLKEKIELNLSIEPDELEIIADEKLIGQVLINLVKNAKEALSGIDKGKVILKAYREVDKKIIKVIDNGKGIIPTEMENIFVPFFTTKEKGSGIGLSLSRQIMRLHKGTVKVHSIPGKETTFILQF